MTDAAKQACAAIQKHINHHGYSDIPDALRGRNSVPVFVNHMEIGLDVPEEALAFTLAVMCGCKGGTLVQVLAQAPFDLHNFFTEHTYDDGFSCQLPNGDVENIRGFYSKVLQAFAVHDPEQLRDQAPIIQSFCGETIFSMLETGIPEVELGHIIERNLLRCRQQEESASYKGMYEHMLSESQYLLMFDDILPSANAGEFLVKSGVLNQGFINSVMNRNYFWEGLFHAATNESARSQQANRLAMHLCFKLNDYFPGVLQRIVRSLDFGALEDTPSRLKLFDYIFKRIPSDNAVLTSTLLQVGLLSAYDLDPQKPFFTQVEVLNTDMTNPHLQRFMETPNHLMHCLLSEIVEMPLEEIGLSVFTRLNFITRQSLPEQEFCEEVVNAATLKLVTALANHVMLHAPDDSMKARNDLLALAGLRSFNTRFLQRWGFDCGLFDQATADERGIVAIAGFELTTLDDIAPNSLSRRLESDLGL